MKIDTFFSPSHVKYYLSRTYRSVYVTVASIFVFFFAPCTFAQEPHKTRLPGELSKHQPTILPILTSDGKRLYFDRKHHPDNTGSINDFDEIWVADRLPNGNRQDGEWNTQWSKPRNIGAPLNTVGSDVFCSLSPDNRTALVYGVYDRELPVKNQGFSLTHERKGAWQFPVPIQIENFYNRTKKYYARLAPDNRTLLLALQRDESLGGLDLYVSFRKANALDTTMVWTEPKHLGNTINTSAYDGSPHLASDGTTLYFSSEGLGGNGVADLFVTRRLDDSWQKWSKPVNLGSGINSREEDSSIDVSLDGSTAYFVSSEDVQDSISVKGLFTATLPDSMRHTGAVLLTGEVSMDKNVQKFLDNMNIPKSAEILIQAYSVSVNNGKLSQTPVSLAETSREEGQYALSLPRGALYLVKANIVGAEGVNLVRTVIDTRLEAFGTTSTNTRTNTRTNTHFERRLHNIVFRKEATNIVFPPVRFAREQSTISPEYAPVLAWIAEEIEDAGNIQLTITGHTCDLGTDEENDELGMRRAEAVAEVLESFGVNHSQMLVRSKGEHEALERSQLEDVRIKNRRVEILLRRTKGGK
jgi:OmpA-OmpF porin, OOP family